MSSSRRDILLFLFAAAVPVYGVLSYYYLPFHYIFLIGEELVGENATAIAFLCAAYLMAKVCLAQKKAGKPWQFSALFALGALFCGGEEISWGSRLLFYSFPAVQRINSQNEVSLHNIPGVGFDSLVGYAFIFYALYGVLCPLGEKLIPPFRNFCARINFPIPPLWALPLYIGASILGVNFGRLIIDKGDEVSELCVALGALAIAARYAYQGQTAKLPALLFNITAVAALFVVFGPQKFKYDHLSWREWLSAEVVYPVKGPLQAAIDIQIAQTNALRHEKIFGSSQGGSRTSLALKRERAGIFPNYQGALPESILAAADGYFSAAVSARMLKMDAAIQQRYLSLARQALTELSQQQNPPSKEAVLADAKISALEGNFEPAEKLLLPGNNVLAKFEKVPFGLFITTIKDGHPPPPAPGINP